MSDLMYALTLFLFFVDNSEYFEKINIPFHIFAFSFWLIYIYFSSFSFIWPRFIFLAIIWAITMLLWWNSWALPLKIFLKNVEKDFHWKQVRVRCHRNYDYWYRRPLPSLWSHYFFIILPYIMRSYHLLTLLSCFFFWNYFVWICLLIFSCAFYYIFEFLVNSH